MWPGQHARVQTFVLLRGVGNRDVDLVACVPKGKARAAASVGVSAEALGSKEAQSLHCAQVAGDGLAVVVSGLLPDYILVHKQLFKVNRPRGLWSQDGGARQVKVAIVVESLRL